jgi:hypothetical protein
VSYAGGALCRSRGRGPARGEGRSGQRAHGAAHTPAMQATCAGIQRRRCCSLSSMGSSEMKDTPSSSQSVYTVMVARGWRCAGGALLLAAACSWVAPEISQHGAACAPRPGPDSEAQRHRVAQSSSQAHNLPCAAALRASAAGGTPVRKRGKPAGLPRRSRSRARSACGLPRHGPGPRCPHRERTIERALASRAWIAHGFPRLQR